MKEGRVQGLKWGAMAFGVTLAVIVGLETDAHRLALAMGILIGMVAMLPLTAGLLLTLAAYRPQRQRIVEGRSRTAGTRRVPRAAARARRRGGWTHLAPLARPRQEVRAGQEAGQ